MTETGTLQRPFSASAIVGIVFAVLFWPVGLVLGLVALARTRAGQRRGRGLAIAALVVSVVLGAYSITMLATGHGGFSYHA